MRIVIDARIISSSTGRYVERLLTYLEKIDKQNEYIALVRSRDVDTWRPTNPNFSTLVADVEDFSLSEQTKLLTTLYSLRPDLVHFCMPQQPVLYCGKKITTIHDLHQLKAQNPTKNQIIFNAKKIVGRYVFKSVINTSHHIITDSEYSKHEIEQFSKKAIGKTSVIYLAADRLASNKSIRYPLPSSSYILYVGQQSPHKNIRRLIQAHQLLLEQNPDLYLVLVGKINQLVKDNMDWVDKNNYKNVVFTGFVADDQLAWLYENARCYGFSSLMEGFGLPGLEAMQHGTPVVSSNATCSPEIFGDAALYFDPYNVNDMAETIGSVINNEALRKSLISRGYERLKEFSWKKMAQETHATYLRSLGLN